MCSSSCLSKQTNLSKMLNGLSVMLEFQLLICCVSLTDGYSYEREAIETWIRTPNHTSPMTNLPLQTTILTPNRSLKMAIQRWKASQWPSYSAFSLMDESLNVKLWQNTSLKKGEFYQVQTLTDNTCVLCYVFIHISIHIYLHMNVM